MSAGERRFEHVGGEPVWQGEIISVSRERFRHEDGVVVEREVVHHPGAVAIIAHDDDHVWLVRQPRHAVGDPDSLEIPAGKRDVDGEPPLRTAQRELAEEIGMRADRWEPVLAFCTSLGVIDEVIALYHATGLHGDDDAADEDERIEIVRWPLADLAGAIAATRDSKTLIALMWLREWLRVV